MHDRASLLAPGLVTADAHLEQEFEARLVETSSLAFRVAFSVLRHQQDAEDVAQESFAKAYRHFTSLSRPRPLPGLARPHGLADGAGPAARQPAKGRARIRRRRILSDARGSAPVAALPAVADERAALWAAIDALPEKLRVVIVLASIEGHDMREVAALLRIPEGTVKSRLFLARRRLKEALR